MLNVSTRTVRRMLEKKQLQWAGNQVLYDSIVNFLNTARPADETDADVEHKLQISAAHVQARNTGRRVLSRGIQ